MKSHSPPWWSRPTELDLQDSPPQPFASVSRDFIPSGRRRPPRGAIRRQRAPAHQDPGLCCDSAYPFTMINFVLLISRQGKVRLTKWYSPYTQKERTKVIRELSGLILTRGPKLCNFVEWRGYKVVYRRYASLYFCMCIDAEDNELEVLEIIHHFVEILDRYFGSVCELDLIFNFHKAYYILDEILIAGELQESSKKNVARLIAAQDSLVEAAKEEASSISNIIAQATK
ncbi:AP-1 complex subunit sigma-1 [Zea mays]|uniref:Adaptor AP-1 19 kDa protein n=1 Tax=Zea mays TaxID=4577 RepID=A0A317YFT4_MAIZE|nr:AP-1 complex subunit sigma-1 [Zea mays]